MKNGGGGKLENDKILRQKAEECLKGRRAKACLVSTTETDTSKLIHELEVHQIELEMQNDELRLAKEHAVIAAEKYAELYDFAPSGYFTLSKEGDIIELNFSGSQMLGSGRSLLRGSRFGFFVSDDAKPMFNRFIDEVFSFKTKASCEVTLSTNGNQPMYVHLKGISSENGEQCLVTATDITELIIADREIKRKNEQLIVANATKDKFFSIIAHDLRNPFSAFLGLTQIMVEELSSLTMHEVRDIAVNMRSSATNLFRLLENLLHWARIQQGLIPFNQEIVHLQFIINEGLEMVRVSAKSKSIEIVSDISSGLLVFADNAMIQTVTRNLVSNAVKFTHKGGKVIISAKPNGNKSIQIVIKDNGIGMSPALIEGLFKPDVNTNRIGTDYEPSTGLGLILCKEFVEKHGGKLLVDSEVDKGSTFSFSLPQA